MIVLTGITKRKRQYKNAHKSRSTTREFFFREDFQKREKGNISTKWIIGQRVKKGENSSVEGDTNVITSCAGEAHREWWKILKGKYSGGIYIKKENIVTIYIKRKMLCGIKGIREIWEEDYGK